MRAWKGWSLAMVIAAMLAAVGCFASLGDMGEKTQADAATAADADVDAGAPDATPAGP